MRNPILRVVLILLAPALLVLAGCGGGLVSANPANSSFFLSPATGSLDTNCTGCNSTRPQGNPVEQFTATLNSGGQAPVSWSVSGGDAKAGPGSISANGLYTPPTYLTADSVEVLVTATLDSNPAIKATAVLRVTPGFLQPLTPENVALGASGTVTVTGSIAEAGGSMGINFALGHSATAAGGGQGSLNGTSCTRGPEAFTSCTTTYSAPVAVAATGATYIVASVGATPSLTAAEVLLNTAGVSSNPAGHQEQMAARITLGSSGGNNTDYDVVRGQIVDCCGGTLGALVQDGGNKQYLLSNNHVLARSDQASVGDNIVQPGLIDNNCTPNGYGGGTRPVGALTGWLPLSSHSTNADAAIAQVASGSVDPMGSILELGGRQPDGTLESAPPGISSTGGHGETPSLDLKVAKSGRTTGLTCASVSVLALDVNVDYFLDCAETEPYLSKTFTNQIAISGNGFADAGDSGSLVVDTANAEPVGLFFAGGTDASGVSQAVANPAGDVLSELSALAGLGGSFSFVGSQDHGVSCLNYGDSTVSAAQARALSDSEIFRAQQALGLARTLVNPFTGVLGVAMAKSNDHPGEAAVIVYVDENANPAVPESIMGVRTMVIPTNARAVALGSAPLTSSIGSEPALPAAVLNAAVAIKQQVAAVLMKQNPEFFGIGVGQSLDNPREAALVIYVDRKGVPAQLPEAVDGLRTRYIVMDRLHVTRSYATPVPSRLHCMPKQDEGFEPESVAEPRGLGLD
jgi:hypothetical protein